MAHQLQLADFRQFGRLFADKMLRQFGLEIRFWDITLRQAVADAP